MKSNDPTYIPNELASAVVGGYVTSAEQIKDYSLNLSQEAINQIALGSSLNSTFTASPSAVFVNSTNNISLNASSPIEVDIVIKKGTTSIKSGRGTILSHTDSLTPNQAGNTTYTAEFSMGTLTKTVSKNIAAVYPIKYGAGSTYTDATNQASIRTTPAGTYNIVVSSNESYIFFNIPSSMSINKATMNGFNFPLEDPINITIDGVTYKSYQSSNTYDAGTLTIVIS